MVRVKICGLTRKSDITIVNELLPEYAGFVFAPGRRRLTIEKAVELTCLLDDRIEKAGVFVNERPEALRDTVERCSLDIIQLHGDETPEYIDYLKELLKNKGPGARKIWKAVRVKNEQSLEDIGKYNLDTLLLDAWNEAGYGGLGKTFDWKLSRRVADKYRVVLAGGLDSTNVSEAIKMVSPYAVDTSSGVESCGLKDRGRIEEFIKAVRSCGTSSV